MRQDVSERKVSDDPPRSPLVVLVLAPLAKLGRAVRVCSPAALTVMNVAGFGRYCWRQSTCRVRFRERKRKNLGAQKVNLQVTEKMPLESQVM